MSSSPSFLQRLKDRKIVQWAVAYVAGTWLLLEILGRASEVFHWPGVIEYVAFVLAAFGFLVVLVIAWYHGEKGRQWVSGPELLIIALLLLISGGVVSTTGPNEEDSESSVAPSVRGPEDGVPSVAVLPCENLSVDPADEHLATGFHAEILHKLDGISSLNSAGPASVEWYGRNLTPPSQIAEELGTAFIGSCSVRKFEEKIRLTFLLQEGETGRQVWSDNFDRDLTAEDLFDIQSEIAQQVADALGAKMTPDEQIRNEAIPTKNLEAYTLYLQGLEHWNRFTEQDAQLAIGFFERAIAVDSAFALAYAGLANTYSQLGLGFGRGAARPRVYMPLAKSTAGRAIDLDPNVALAYSTLGMIATEYDYDYEEAHRLFNLALATGVDIHTTSGRRALLLWVEERFDEAIEEKLRSVDADPLRLISRADLGWIYLYAGRISEAKEAAQFVRELDPSFVPGEFLTAFLALHEGRNRDAVEALIRAGGEDAENPRIRATLGYTYALMDDEASARRILDDLLALEQERYVTPKHIGVIYLGLGEDETALDWFEKGLEARADWMNQLQFHPGIDRLRPHPRFQELLRRMNLPPDAGTRGR